MTEEFFLNGFIYVFCFFPMLVSLFIYFFNVVFCFLFVKGLGYLSFFLQCFWF